MTVQLVRFETAGVARAGLLRAGEIRDLARVLGREAPLTMDRALSDWSALEGLLSALTDADLTAIEPETDALLLAPLAASRGIFCAGSNYRDHAAEMAAHRGVAPPDPRGEGQRPWFFVKAPQTICDPNGVTTVPQGCEKLDWEVELAAVIGRPCLRASLDNALAHVMGYTVAIDYSARDLSRRDMPPGSPFRFDWLSHKSFDGALPLGPAITPAFAIGDPQELSLSLAVNGEVMQDSSTEQMTFSLAEQIVELSRNMTLMPGDLILTGTPAGVGSGRGRFLAPGDRVVAEIEKIGVLTNSIAI